MLCKEAVERGAVRDAKFHLWSDANVAEGIELLTGVKAGSPLPLQGPGKQRFEKDTVFERVNQRLVDMLEIIEKAMFQEMSKHRERRKISRFRKK